MRNDLYLYSEPFLFPCGGAMKGFENGFEVLEESVGVWVRFRKGMCAVFPVTGDRQGQL